MNKWSDIQDLKKKKALLDEKWDNVLEIEPMLGTSGEGFYRTEEGWVHVSEKDFINQPERKEDDKERTNKRAD